MTEAAPTAQGSLEATPLGHLLVYGLDRMLTGTLVLEESSGKRHAIYFDDGGPSKAKIQDPILFLGRVLVEQKAITDAVYDRTLVQATERGELHGQVLLEQGHIDEHALREGLREQLSRQVLWMFSLPPDTLFGYYDRQNFLEHWGGNGVRAKPLALIWRGVREYVHAGHMAEVLSRFGDQPILLHIDAPIRRFRFDRREQSIIDVLRAKPQPLSELLERGLADPAYVRRLLYAMLITRQLESGIPGVEPIGVDEAASSSRMQVAPALPLPPSGATRHPSPSASSLPPEPSPKPVESPELAAFKTEIRELAGHGNADYYELLGVALDATQPVIQAAFFQLAKKWHPDRLGPDLADVRDLATKVFARMSEANQILGDPARRKEYDELRKDGAGGAEEQEQVQRVLRAATAFQKAEVLMKRNNHVAALEEARKAVELDPSQADYIALLAWIESTLLNANLEEILARIEKAQRLEPNNTRIRWYRGSILKRLGKSGRAMGDFRFIVENDPRHLDAQREIRLYDMRKAEQRRTGQKSPSDRPSAQPARSSGAPAPATVKPGDSGSRFGKWFKR
ncbi:MAG TPA: DnaJ domain-containing protein [Polyangiaceae bacterium]|nr:DnaJ domain-containing protein [Polyangiaceae bacterium]